MAVGAQTIEREIGPICRIETVAASVPEALETVDLVVVGVDGERVKYVINEACLARALPAIYAGVYERGEGGDVFNFVMKQEGWDFRTALEEQTLQAELDGYKEYAQETRSRLVPGVW